MRRAVLLMALVAAPVLAQGKPFESPLGFRVKLPKECQVDTLDPKDQILLGKFRALCDGFQCEAWVFRYRKATAAVTGGGNGNGTDGDSTGKDKPQSLKEAATAAFNDAHSLQGLLDLRLGKDRMSSAPNTKEKPIKWKGGVEAAVFEGTGVQEAGGAMRAFVGGDGVVEFGIVGLGPRGKDWDKVLQGLAESLEFFEAVNVSSVAVAAGLRDPDFRQQVRAKLQPGWVAHDTDNFILITDCPNKVVVSGLLTDLEIMRKCYLERFPPIGPMEKVSLVRVFKSYEEYAAYGKLDGAIGHFSPLDDELVLFDPGKKIPKRSEWLKDVDTAEVLYHEAMHQYLHEANGFLAPASWFGEGFGEVFAGAVLDRRKETVTKIERNKGRMIWIKRSQKSGGWPDLRAFVKMTQPDFYGPSVYQNYAFAWAFCHFLEEQRKDPKGNKEWGGIADRYLASLRDITDEYRRKMPKDAPKDWIMGVRFDIQEKAFDKTFTGTDWGALEKAWIDAMKKW